MQLFLSRSSVLKLDVTISRNAVLVPSLFRLPCTQLHFDLEGNALNWMEISSGDGVYRRRSPRLMIYVALLAKLGCELGFSHFIS